MTIQAFRQPLGVVGLTGPSGFSGLGALKAMGLDQGVYSIDSLRDSASTLHSLQYETNSEIFSANLFSLARELEGRHNEAGAQRLYQGLQLWSPDSKWGKAVAHRQAVLNGNGSLSEKCERTLQGLLYAGSDTANLGAMYAGLRVFSAVSNGLIGAMGGSSWVQQAIATAGAYALEVPTYTLSHRSLRVLEGISNPTSIKADLISNAKTLGVLKVTGLAGAHAVAALGQTGFTRWAIPQASMFLGALGVQGLEVAEGSQKYRGIESLLANAATNWLHFNVFGKVLGPLAPESNGSKPRSSTPLSSPFTQMVTDTGVIIPFRAQRFVNTFTKVYTKGGTAESPPLPPVAPSDSDIPLSDPTPRASGIQPAGTHWYESMKRSLGGITSQIQGEYSFTSKNWASEMSQVAARLVRETNSIRQKMEKDSPHSPDLRRLGDIQYELDEISERLSQLSEQSGDIPLEHVRPFLKVFYRFPNILINFIDGKAELNGNASSNENVDLNFAMPTLLPARQTLDFLLHFDKLPQGALLGEEPTLYHREKVSAVAGDFHWQYEKLGSSPNNSWTLDSSMAMQEFGYVLRSIRQSAEALGHHSLVLQEMTALHQDVEGVINGLNVLARDPSRLPSELNRRDFINNLYQVPNSLAEFLLDSNIQDLISARRFARVAQYHLDKHLPSLNDDLEAGSGS